MPTRTVLQRCAFDSAPRQPLPPPGSALLDCRVVTDARDVRLFSYGTLRQEGVQLAVFGRRLDGERDAIAGYRLDYLTITEPDVVATSGSDRHPVLRPAAEPDGAVEGTAFWISERELLAADEYEVDDYQRIEVPLRSGMTAWVYVFRPA